jgi:8-oxo-dGTP pyrophosphatase MutT (NUDIX family)
MTSLLRHVQAVQNVTLPADRLAFKLAEEQVGWVPQSGVDVLLAQRFGCTLSDGAITLPWAEDLPGLARALANAGAFRWRDEAFDVCAEFDGKVLATIDRGALPWFGIRAEGVHVNGIVRRSNGIHLWIARRAANRLLDPGKLDHLFAGGISAGMDAEDTLIKEGAEEAGFPQEIVDRAVYAGSLRYTTLRPEGLRRDRIHCYDLVLPEGLTPVASDGEVAAFELWHIDRVVQTLRETDRFKFNVSLVIIDFLLRWHLLPDTEETQQLTGIFRK